MQEWTDEKIREWILNKCRLYREENPGGLGYFIQNENLTKDDPPLGRIAENVTFLQDKNLVTANIERVSKPDEKSDVSYILNLKLTSFSLKKKTI